MDCLPEARVCPGLADPLCGLTHARRGQESQATAHACKKHYLLLSQCHFLFKSLFCFGGC